MKEYELDEYLEMLEASRSCSNCKKVRPPKLEKDTRYIFISYAHKDYKKVYADLAGMSVKGIPFYYDYRLRAGKKWEEEIRTYLEDPRCVGAIFYISENFFLSESIQKEIRFVFEKAKKSFSVNLTGQEPSQILNSAFDSMPRRMADKSFAQPSWREKLNSFFPDDVTYVSFEEDEHLDRIIDNIQINFNIFPLYNRFDFGDATFSSGKGEFHFPDGTVYNGAFENGRFSGRGILTCSNGDVYEGRWKNGAKDGRGKMTYPNGVTYEGSWKNDKKNGKCVYTHPDGTVYSGFWKNDKRHGKGMLKLPNCMVNEGQWENNQFTGLGTCTWPDGRKYQGQWLKGSRHGTGTMTWKDGSVYVGQWENSKKHGLGTLKFSNGMVMSGRFENDKFIGPEE